MVLIGNAGGAQGDEVHQVYIQNFWAELRERVGN